MSVSLNWYWRTVTSAAQNGMTVQSLSFRMPDAPSKVRRTFDQSRGLTRRWAPKSSSWRPPRSVKVALSPSGTMTSAKPFWRAMVSTNALLSPPWRSRSVASELLPSTNTRKWRVTCRSALNMIRDSR